MKALDQVLEKLQPVIDDNIKMTKEHFLNNGKKFTKFDEEWLTLSLQYDIVKAFSKYVLNTDELIDKNFECRISKGTIVVRLTILRDGEEYGLHSDAIYAGGYNIQRLHVRYLINTNLPKKIEDKDFLKEIKSKMKKMDKEQELIKSIEHAEKTIVEKKEQIESLEAMSKDEIVENSDFKDLYRTELCDLEFERKAWIEKNNDVEFNTPEEWNQYKEERIYVDAILEPHLSRIKLYQSVIKGREQAIKSYTKKLEKLCQS